MPTLGSEATRVEYRNQRLFGLMKYQQENKFLKGLEEVPYLVYRHVQ